jgi:tyrosyl-tRNA synthetase
MGFLEVMRERGLIAQITHEDELAGHLGEGPRIAYCGFDPSADSLHVGHLMPVMALRRWQAAGHKSVALIGGGTGLIGDPSGKSEMRQMIDSDGIQRNLAGIRTQLERFIDLKNPARGVVVNNADWLAELKYLPFLRDIGRHFSVNRMLAAECFKQRLEKGLSFLEFNYMLLQSYDFLHLFRSINCTVQLGGDDQWSNMLSGVDLVRRLTSSKAFCVTMPLLTTPDGRKMGKTEKGAVWLDAAKTSPFEYFQYWRNVEDVMVDPCLRYFTDLEMAEVTELNKAKGAAINDVKKRLAWECTKIAHGESAANEARESADRLFSAAGGHGGQASGNEPEHFVDRAALEGRPDISVVDMLAFSGVVPTKAEAKRLIQQGGLSVDDARITDLQARIPVSELEKAAGCLVRKGKKHYHRVRLRG